MDFLPGLEDRTAELLDAHDFDYVVGSVHFLGDLAVDHDGWDVWEGDGDPDTIWSRYFETLAEAAAVGPVRHPRPPRPGQGLGLRPAAARPRPALPLRARDRGDRRGRGSRSRSRPPGCASRSASSIPAPAFAEMCVDAGAAFSLSSDAHVPEDIGFAYEQAVETMRGWGIERGRRVRAPRAPDGAAGLMATRVGIGYDSHRFGGAGPLVLGGVEVAHERGLDGPQRRRRAHPRGDRRGPRRRRPGRPRHPLPARATSAGATPTRSTCCGSSSASCAASVANVDATVVCEQPRLGRPPARDGARLAEALSAPVSVKATTNEGMGSIGRGEGIACYRGGATGTGLNSRSLGFAAKPCSTVSARSPTASASARSAPSPTSRSTSARWPRPG